MDARIRNEQNTFSLNNKASNSRNSLLCQVERVDLIVTVGQSTNLHRNVSKGERSIEHSKFC
jgi:hypothetical protein